jgi:hypothetical protein
VIRNFTSDGHERGSDTQTIPITVPAARADAPDSRYDVLARATLPKAGRYEIRIAAHSAISNTRGSVYLDVTVPDFRKDRVSLSGIILSALPAPGPVAPARALADLTPLVPMTERIFGAGDVVTAFARVYQGGNDAMAATTVTVRIVDAADKPVFEHAEPIAADRFDVKTRSADYQTRLRADGLAPGTYLLSIEAAAGRNAARRDIVFTIR